jgi:hypothetical protein
MAKSKGKEVYPYSGIHINPFTCGILANLSLIAIDLIDLKKMMTLPNLYSITGSD